MKPISPFQYNRWETDREHIIWLPKKFSEWEEKRCVYFTGSRGSGKTTLLRGFEWSQRLTNDSLRKQLDTDPFAKCYIGVYLSMPDYITRQFINFPPRKSDMDEVQWEEEKARVYSLYIEYQILQLFIGGIQGLRGEKILKFHPEHELETVKKILQERPEINNFFPEEIIEPRLNDLRLCFKRMHENIRMCAINRLELQQYYPALQMGQMLEEIVGILIDLCSKEGKIADKEENGESKRWTLKVCIDQTESPEHYQQKSINTIVARQVTGNVSFAIASLSGRIDINSTFIPQHPLTDADREHYPLEEVYKSPAKFHEFVTSVINLRFRKFTGMNAISIDLRFLLGEWDLNALLYPALKSSEKRTVREFILKSEENIGVKFFDFQRKGLPLEQLDEVKTEIVENEENLDDYLPEDKKKSDIPPLYQTYLVEKLKLKFPHEESEKFEIRTQKSREIRKKMTAAMLCLCKEYEIAVPFAGYYMVMSLSDHCIRDFLRQMHEIYLAENVSPEKFVKQQINIKKQNEAIHKASDIRYDGISNETPHHVSEIRKLVDYLGKITADIQSAFNDPSTLKTIEKGRFNIDYSKMKNEDKSKLKDILNTARDSHYIKDLSNEKIELFRLHRLFAPKFGFSYRGAYSNVSLQGNDLLKLCTEKDDQECKKIMERVVSNIVKVEKTKTLDKWSDSNE